MFRSLCENNNNNKKKKLELMGSKEHHVPVYARKNVQELGDMMAATNIKRVLSFRESVQNFP